MWPNLQIPADLVIFTEEFFDGKQKRAISSCIIHHNNNKKRDQT